MSDNTESCARLESEAQIVDGKLVIALRISTLAHAARHSDYFDHCAEAGSPLKITDEALFAKSVAYALNAEEEDGSTPITRMLDKAFEHVCEQGEDGVEEAQRELERTPAARTGGMMDETNSPAAEGPLEASVRRLACWWLGCQPDYEHPCVVAPNYVVPCKRCGAPDTSFSDRVGDSRSNRAKQWAWWWLWRKWWPAKCGACGKRFGNHEQCDDFPF